jgi:uncharacterized damage-inducible protein DinB
MDSSTAFRFQVSVYWFLAACKYFITTLNRDGLCSILCRTVNNPEEHEMAISDAILPEFDHEMANTRKTLERVPDDKFSYKPHEKSGTMGWLAGHLATIPMWVVDIMGKESFDIAPAGNRPQPPPAPKNAKELVEVFDKHVASARKAIAGASDAQMFQNWSLLNNGQNIMTMPRIACLRSFLMNHSIHHRAQLGVYLRLNNVPVPAIYGPSADEGSF